MKAQFYFGMGLGMAAGAAVTALVKSRQKDMKRMLDQAAKKISP